MESISKPELELVSFAVDPLAQEFLSASSRLAADCAQFSEAPAASVSQLVAAAERVRGSGLAELLASIEDDCDCTSLLFQVADLLGHGNVTVAWQGLIGVPAAVVLARCGDPTSGKEYALALPTPTGGMLMQPLLAAQAGSPAWCLHGSELILVDTDAPTAAGGVLGCPHGNMQSMSPLQETSTRVRLSSEHRALLVELAHALFAALLHGVLRRLVAEAYSYASTRKSAGKPIHQHQAVSLRLADLVLFQQGLSLYMNAAISGSGEVRGLSSTSIGYIADTSARIAKDAVQIAAAHGYVDGLPFKRLFEQARTLVSCLQMWSRVAIPGSDHLHSKGRRN